MGWLPVLIVELALVAFFTFGWVLWQRRQRRKGE